MKRIRSIPSRNLWDASLDCGRQVVTKTDWRRTILVHAPNSTYLFELAGLRIVYRRAIFFRLRVHVIVIPIPARVPVGATG